jgi:hypothetical protein
MAVQLHHLRASAGGRMTWGGSRRSGFGDVNKRAMQQLHYLGKQSVARWSRCATLGLTHSNTFANIFGGSA